MEPQNQRRTISTLINTDIQVFKLIHKKFSLFVPFLISIVAIFAVVLIPLITGFNGQVLAYLYRHFSYTHFINFSFPIEVFIYSFICCALYTLSYVFLGYILRKKYLHIQESPTAVLTRYVRLSGYILLLACTWFIILCTIGGRRRNGISSLVTRSLTDILTIFKLFLYINLVRVSLGDEKSDFKQTYEYVKKDTYQILTIWFGSGLLVSMICFGCIVLLAVFGKAGFIPNTITVQDIVAPAIFLGFGFVFIFRAFAEQIGTFSVYLKDNNNVDILN